jgi:hypothetical protein
MDFRGDKNSSHDFLRREVKPSVQCHNILQHIKELCGVLKRNSRPFLAKLFPATLPGASTGFARELWWMNQE